MKVLVIGSGGREHALAWKLAQSPKVTQVFVAPGNAGTALEPKVCNVNIDSLAIAELKQFAEEERIALTIVGPENPLSIGIVDLFSKADLPCFGPTRAAALLESSKAFSKDFMRQYKIPTARYQVFTEIPKALAYLATQSYPIVIKADGLAAGKGVVIAQDADEAEKTVREMLSEKVLGDASNQIVIEEFLQGEEASFIVMADGNHAIPLASSQDHKTRDEGDVGPNTGGMGAYSPAPIVTPELEAKILRTIIEPTLSGMRDRGTPYTGFLYAGLMITPSGDPKVLEFNCRLGDPEAQVILPRLRSDLVTACECALEQKLYQCTLDWDKRACLGVVLAAGGYPLSYRKFDMIEGLTSDTPKDTKIFHAGTLKQEQHIVTNGGRVLCVTALGDNVLQARDRAYRHAETIDWPDRFYRKDIGHRAIKREQT